MKKTFILLIIAIPLLSFILSPVIFIRSDIKVDSLLVLPPVAEISLISKGSRPQIDEDLSKKTFDITYDYLQNGFPNSIKTKYHSPDSTSAAKLNNFVATIITKINSEKQARKYHLPDSIVSLFNTANARFVFCTLNWGFKRTRDNFINTYHRREIVNFFIIPMAQPHESLVTVTCMILDLKQKNIVYYRRDVLENRDPTDIKIIKLQLSRIINHFFI